jgi:hypothetical protein
MMSMIYPGLAPSNVSKDAKYSIRTGENGMEVQLTYRVSDRERALLSTDRHEPLVDMVNAVKTDITGQPGGAFYINEFKDVLVPADGECYFAGIYDPALEFDFDGPIVSPRAPDDLEPGDPWLGPHVGIHYTLAAGGNDIKWFKKTGRISREERLSDHVGEAVAADLSRRLARTKGSEGGRIYINECCEFFSPPSGGGSEYLYLGSLDEDVWFPPPDVPGRP